MAKAVTHKAVAAEPEKASHYRFKVKAPIYEAGTQFVPGVVYTVKAAVFAKVKGVAVNPQPIDIKE